MTNYRHAHAAGVRKAPRHEIAAAGSAAAVPRVLWGFGGGVRVEKVGAEGECKSVCREGSVRTQGCGRWLHGAWRYWRSAKLRIERSIASADIAGHEAARMMSVAKVVNRSWQHHEV